jgi:cysteine-rich repeat protein
VRAGVWALGLAAAGCFVDGGNDELGESGTAAAETGPTEATCGPPGCAEPVCGDGVAMAPEECDDGNADDSDACTRECRLAACGDGYVQGGEECDAGPANGDAQACTSACRAAVCGDGLVQAGVEGCDDGNTRDGDACSSVCQPAQCGDGKLDPGEGCDDGNAADDDDCRADCTPAACGDGVVNTGGAVPEACDDGDADDTDECTSECTLPACGDGLVQAGEGCDDGNVVPDDTCDATCQRRAYHIFVTSTRYDGALGGLAGADAKCNEHAAAAGLPGAGRFMAWLSTGQVDARDRLLHSEVPYILPSNTQVANHWNELSGGGLDHPISEDELGMAVAVNNPNCETGAGLAWTGSQNTGNALMQHCEDWTVNLGATGVAGFIGEVEPQWSAVCLMGCTLQARLYCLEQ